MGTVGCCVVCIGGISRSYSLIFDFLFTSVHVDAERFYLSGLIQ